jgi:hypothetical protein
MLTEAARPPVAVGLKVAEIEQDAPTARVAGLTGHVFVWAKSPTFAPVIAMLPIVSGPPPEFVSVVAFAALVVPTTWEPKLWLVGDSVTIGELLVPVPVSGTVCGLPSASSVTWIDAVRLPVDVGVNVALIVQLEPAASVAGPAGHVLV